MTNSSSTTKSITASEPLSPEAVGRHKSHCCRVHGCSFDHEACPVVQGEVEQWHRCYYCPTQEEVEDAKRVLAAEEELKRLGLGLSS